MLLRVMCVLLFLGWTAEAPDDTVLFSGHWRSPLQIFGPLFVSLPAINLFAWQLLLLAIAPFCLLRPGAFRKRAWAMDAAIMTSLASVAVTFLWGWLNGGSPYAAYFQLWRFLVALLVGLLLLSVIRNARDLRALGLTILVAALARGILAVYFYWVHVRGRIDPPPSFLTTHDDSLLFVAGLLIMLSWALARDKWQAWLGAGLVSALLLCAITLNNRRLAWIALLLVLGCVYILLRRGRARRRVNRSVLVAAPLVLVYAIVGWGREGALFEPLRAIATSGSDEDSSSLARLEEMKNLMYTLSVDGNPLLGTGWGRGYREATSFYTHFTSGWWLYPYTPHNSLHGAAAFAGLAGLLGILLVVPVTAFLATRGFRASTTPVDRTAAMAAVCILPAYGVQCFGDIGLQSLTAGLILGVAIAVAGKVPVSGLRRPSELKPGGSMPQRQRVRATPSGSRTPQPTPPGRRTPCRGSVPRPERGPQ